MKPKHSIIDKHPCEYYPELEEEIPDGIWNICRKSFTEIDYLRGIRSEVDRGIREMNFSVDF